MYSPTGSAVLVKGVKVAVGNQFAPVDTRLDCSQASQHSHLQFQSQSHSILCSTK